MPPRERYRSYSGRGRTTVGANRPSAPPGERGGGGYVAPSRQSTKPSAPPSIASSPKPFVEKKVSKSVSTSDVATGKFTGGTQRPTPKPKPDKTFTKIPGPIQGLVSPPPVKKTIVQPRHPFLQTPPKKIIPKETERETAIKKYATTGLEKLGEHRKKEVEKILSSGQSDIVKREEIKKRNLRGAIPGLMKDVTKDKELFVPPSKSPWPSQRGTWSEVITSAFMPLTNRMIYDANNIWGKGNYQSDAMRHLMYATIYPVQAAGHEALDSRYVYTRWNPRSWERNIQDMHNNTLREKVLQRARELGGTSYENIRKAAFEMVSEQEERTAKGLEPLFTLPITDLEHEKKLYPNLERKTYTKNLMEPVKSLATTWATKASLQGYIEAAKYATNQLMNWGKQWQ